MLSVCKWFVLFYSVILSFYLFSLMNQGRTEGERWSTANIRTPTPHPLPLSSNFIPGRPKASLLFWFFGDLYAAYCYLWLFSLYINIKKVKIVVKC